MSHEGPLSEEQKESGTSRRKFIAGAASAALGAATLGYLGREKLGFGPLADVREAHAEKREAVSSEYERTGELPTFAERKALVILHDLEDYMERSGDSERMSAEAFTKRYDEFYANAYRDAAAAQVRIPEGIPKSPALETLLKLKTGFQKNAGTTYNRDAATLPDPVVERHYQCRSGTLGLELLTLEVAEKENVTARGETLVSVYTEGHVQPGVLLKDGTLLTVEMTSAGHGIRNFGNMRDIKLPMRVVRADHGMLQEALHTESHRDKAVLYETVRDVRPPETGTMPRLGIFGFGEPKVPAGDIQMPSADVLPASDAFQSDRLYNRMEQEPGDEELLGVVTDPQDKTYARNYLVQHRTVNEYYKRYAPIVNGIENLSPEGRANPVPQAEFESGAQEILRIANELDAFVRANNLDEQYFKTEAIIRKYSSTIRMATVPPSDVVRVMRSNIELLRRRR